MKRVPWSLFPGLLVLFSVLTLRGQPWGQPVGGQDLTLVLFKPLAQQIQLTDAQLDALVQLHRTYMEGKRPLVEEVKLAFRELDALVSQEAPNPMEAYEKVEQINQLRSVILHNALASLLERKKILTPEQSERLNQLPNRGMWSLMSGGPRSASLPPFEGWPEMWRPQPQE